jgi:hypothetical protein
MNSSVELNLGLILFLPWYAILILAYCRFAPPRARGGWRYAFDAAALLLAVAATTLSLHWSLAIADPTHGKMWAQVLGTSVSYGVFLAVMTCAWFLRRFAFRRPDSEKST